MIQENHPSMVAAAQKIVQSNTPDPASSTIPRTAAEEVDDMIANEDANVAVEEPGAATHPDVDQADNDYPEPCESHVPAREIPRPDTNPPPSWGQPLRPCQTDLQKIQDSMIANGRAPAWPFADWLEFEFVKWLVENDISQGARDKLIKTKIDFRALTLVFPE